MNFFVNLLLALWGVRIIGNIFAYVQLWWVKEYRWDRMYIHLKTVEGRRILFPVWKKPPVRIKSIILTFISFATLLLFVIFLPFQSLVNFLVADVLSFPITVAVVLLLQLPTKIYHWTLISNATQKLRSHMPMTVVGITGSYGKTSVKDYLATILESRLKVLKTDASKNSPIGIAESILHNLRDDHEVFVVEMGAYKKGEIGYMARMVRPTIGIITAINSQHIELFGSIENTVEAKYELLNGLVGKKIGVFNVDDARVKKMSERAKKEGKEVWWWTTRIQNSEFLPLRQAGRIQNKNGFQAKNIRADDNGISFTCLSESESAPVQASLLGEHQVGNVMAAIAGAVACGMSLKDAARAAVNIKPARGVMEKKKGVNGSVFIDDTFNNNPDAARAALAFMSGSKDKKILVFQPMIELGDSASKNHYEVGKYAGLVCTQIFLTNDNWRDDFISGVRASNKTVPVELVSPQKAASIIKSTVGRDDLVLFKGKESARVLRALTH